MIYVASPYSHSDLEVMNHRFRAVERVTAQLLQHKIWCYSPIVHCHELASQYKLPTEHDYWREYNFHMLDRSSALLVHQQEGWDTSIGVTEEIEYSHGINLRIFVHPETETLEDLLSKLRPHNL